MRPITNRGTSIRSVLSRQGHTGQLLRREKPKIPMLIPEYSFSQVSLAKTEDSQGSEELEDE